MRQHTRIRLIFLQKSLKITCISKDGTNYYKYAIIINNDECSVDLVNKYVSSTNVYVKKN